MISQNQLQTTTGLSSSLVRSLQCTKGDLLTPQWGRERGFRRNCPLANISAGDCSLAFGAPAMGRPRSKVCPLRFLAPLAGPEAGPRPGRAWPIAMRSIQTDRRRPDGLLAAPGPQRAIRGAHFGGRGQPRNAVPKAPARLWRQFSSGTSRPHCPLRRGVGF